jgi:outer membrane protein assembly factor BamD (BamD/ComL family)
VSPPQSDPAPRQIARRTSIPKAPSSASVRPTLADEARLVHDGVAALRAGDPARALALFDAHGALYPGGALAEECAAERALALAELGRDDEARAAAHQFLSAHPTSPLAARLRERLRMLAPQP